MRKTCFLMISPPGFEMRQPNPQKLLRNLIAHTVIPLVSL